MGGKSTSSTQGASETKQYPYEPAQGLIGRLLNAAEGQFGNWRPTQGENRAFLGLGQNIKHTNEYLPQMQGLVDNLFKGGGLGEGAQGIRDSWDTANKALTPIARGDFLDMESNPYIQDIVNKTQGDVYNRIGGLFAGSGRTASGAHMNALGSGIGDATNQLYYNAYSGERDRQSGAIRDLLSGSVGAAQGLDATLGNKLGAQQAGAGMAKMVTGMRDDPFLKQLELAQMRRQLPLQNLSQLRDFVLPIASEFKGGHTNSYSNTTTSGNPVQQILGGVLGGLNMLGGGGNPFSLFGSRAGFSPMPPAAGSPGSIWSNIFGGR